MAPSLETNSGEAKNLTHEGEHVQEEDGILFAVNMMSSVVVPLVTRSAVELGIFDILAKAGEGVKLSAEDIAIQIKAKNPEAPNMVDRLLRLLASHSMVSCSISEDQQGLASPQRLYSLTPMSKYFVNDADGVSFGPTLNLPLDKIFMKSWTEMKGAIIEGGIPFNRVYGMNAFEYPGVDPRFNDVFNRAMFNFTAIVMKRVLEFYEGFEQINTLVDVGGGLGINLKLITSKYPHIQGVNFDLPHVVEHAPTYAGVKHEGGDMFESVPNGDVIFMKWILHDWSDEHCLKLLKNCHKAIPNDGRVIVVDAILPAFPESTLAAKAGFQADILMMAQNPGGKERTQQEFMELALGSGFSGIKFVCYVSGFWVMEFFK
ncbi:cathecol O-methyltransferase 1-like [Gastrolobium bilobum]|uniref:cathecol O-methyltransferase 1-like n=1 Tax=Gastrolobium bilobum TaxID=150636 RepID=UPI002AB02F67|nr:cathecol O-methyltransferase 1-like [Gastrolobium bilobum]